MIPRPAHCKGTGSTTFPGDGIVTPPVSESPRGWTPQPAPEPFRILRPSRDTFQRGSLTRILPGWLVHYLPVASAGSNNWDSSTDRRLRTGLPPCAQGTSRLRDIVNSQLSTDVRVTQCSTSCTLILYPSGFEPVHVWRPQELNLRTIQCPLGQRAYLCVYIDLYLSVYRMSTITYIVT